MDILLPILLLVTLTMRPSPADLSAAWGGSRDNPHWRVLDPAAGVLVKRQCSNQVWADSANSPNSDTNITLWLWFPLDLCRICTTVNWPSKIYTKSLFSTKTQKNLTKQFPLLIRQAGYKKIRTKTTATTKTHRKYWRKMREMRKDEQNRIDSEESIDM